jgi:diguanylate cyclase (GGDEF)-like protein/PAS domain S-box-containing protein
MSVWADPVMGWCAAAALASTVWFVLVVVHPVEPMLGGWLLTPPTVMLASLVCWRAGAETGQSQVSRSFWRRVGLALAVFSLSMISRVVDSVNPDLSMTARLSLISAAAHALGVALLVWPLFRLPSGPRSPTQRTALWLDMATVTIAAAVFLWHFAADALLAAPERSPATMAASIGLIVAGLTSVLVVAKVAMTGTASLYPRALRMLGAALAVGGLGTAVTVLLVHKTYVDTSLIVVPVAVFLIALGARFQVVSAGASAASRRRPPRRFSVLPYTAVAATDVLMLVAVAQGTDDRMLIAAAAVGLTALVAVRQVMAFRENDTLLRQLDEGLLEQRRTEQRFESLVQNATDVVSISDPAGLVAYVSPSVRRVLGREPGDLLHTDLAPLLHPDDAGTIAAHIAAIAETPGATTTYHARMAHADGSWRWLEITSANLIDDPNVNGIVTNSRDITETREAQQRLTYEASHDVLTGLANRALFHNRLSAGLTVEDPHYRLSVVLIDLDDFKTVNDTLGHAVGDDLLVAVAEKLRNGIRPDDTVARLGGDEFAIIVNGISGGDVDEILNRIIADLSQSVLVDGHRLTAPASFGVVEGRPGDDPGTLLRQADIAMYKAKELGMGSYRHYQPGMQTDPTESHLDEAARRSALVL